MNTTRKPFKKILVTAGPTIENIDPVRFISNHSTGIMGYEIARRFKEKGFDLCLVSGPVSLPRLSNIKTIHVTTAIEMRDEILSRVDRYDCIVMAAAVCDFRPKKTKRHKIKKRNSILIKLVKTPDILSLLKDKKNLLKVGFALETNSPFENAEKKLKKKALDLIIVNVKTKREDPFGPGSKNYTIIGKNGNIEHFKGYTKRQMAKLIVSRVGKLLCGKFTR